LAIVAAEFARRGDPEAASRLLDEAHRARESFLAAGEAPGSWAYGVRADGGVRALAIRFWHVEALLEPASRQASKAALESLPRTDGDWPLPFDAWLDAGEVEDAIAELARAPSRWRPGFPWERFARLAPRVDAATLQQALTRLPPVDASSWDFYQSLADGVRGAIDRGDASSTLEIAFGYWDRTTQLQEPGPWLAASAIDEYLRRADFDHAATVLDRWRALRPTSPRLFAAEARVRGRVDGEHTAHEVAEWLVGATMGSRAMTMPPLGRILDDRTVAAAVVEDLRSRAEGAYPGEFGLSDGVRAAVLACVIERLTGLAGPETWSRVDDLRIANLNPRDRDSAIAVGLAWSGDVQGALARLQAAARATARGDVRSLNPDDISRVAIGLAKRGLIPELVRAISLDQSLEVHSKNALEYAWDALPRAAAP
jgi:hypothetical protein